MDRLLPIMLILSVTAACGLPDDDDGNNVPDPTETTNAAKEKVQAEVSDTLDCSGVVREETRNLVTDAVAKADVMGDLVVAPEELARFVGAVAVSTDTTALLVANVARIAALGHLPAALGQRWDTLECADEVVVPCVDELTQEERGTATTTVVCDGAEPYAVRATFAQGCTLFVTENAGAVELRRTDGAMRFEDFALGSVRQLEGLLAVDFSDGAVDRLSVTDDVGLSIATNAGKSCEERLTIRELVAELAPQFTSIDIDAERLADEKTVTLLTPDAPATWSKDSSCTCPDSGSVLEWGWKGFLKGQGDARVRLTYAEAASDASCASVAVDIMNWPEACEDGAAGDCGKAAVESLLAPVFSATCVRR